MRPEIFLRAALRVALYCIFIALLFLIPLADAYRGSLFNEWSFVEIGQSLMLPIISGMLLYSALRIKALQASALLLLAFTFSSLIRENDHLFDAVHKHLWPVLVALVIVPALYLTWRRRVLFFTEMETYTQSTSFGLLIGSILTTYVYSRLYGMGGFWRLSLQENYVRTIKNMSEECVELLGYGLMFLAVVEFLRLARQTAAPSTRQ